MAFEALEALERRQYDVVLMDRQMPEMNGIEATARIREMDGLTASIPIIGITAAVNSEEIAACLEAGMNDVIPKPIDPFMLAKALARTHHGGEVLMPGREAAESHAGEKTEAAPGSKVFDGSKLAALRAELGDDVVESLVESFREVAGRAPQSLGAAADQDDLALLERLAHDLKSNSAMIGLQALVRSGGGNRTRLTGRPVRGRAPRTSNASKFWSPTPWTLSPNPVPGTVPGTGLGGDQPKSEGYLQNVMCLARLKLSFSGDSRYKIGGCGPSGSSSCFYDARARCGEVEKWHSKDKLWGLAPASWWWMTMRCHEPCSSTGSSAWATAS